MTIGNATLRGGQTLLHDARMWGQLARWGIMWDSYSPSS